MRHGLAPRDCAAEVLIQIAAGSDTTAILIRVPMLYIISASPIYYRLRNEIDAEIRDGVISSPITSEEAELLPYLQAVIYERLHIHPPFTGLLMKEAPPQGDTYNDIFIPGGTRIEHNTGAMGCNESIFRPASSSFRPERWLEAGPEKLLNMRKTAELAFGHGRWACMNKTVVLWSSTKSLWSC